MTRRGGPDQGGGGVGESRGEYGDQHRTAKTRPKLLISFILGISFNFPGSRIQVMAGHGGSLGGGHGEDTAEAGSTRKGGGLGVLSGGVSHKDCMK